MTPEETYVLSWDDSTTTGNLWAPYTGCYQLYDREWAESGDTQLSDSAYLKISNSDKADGAPRADICVLEESSD
jgi:hypothetical protein